MGKTFVPTFADFADGTDVILVVDSPADSLGRQRHFAYWIADNVGRAGNEVGIRGQVFFSVIAEHVARLQQRGRKAVVRS